MSSVLSLSPRQLQALRAIADLELRDGWAPTLRELGLAVGVGTSRALELVRLLEEKGLIRREAGRSRAMVLTQDARRALAPPPEPERQLAAFTADDLRAGGIPEPPAVRTAEDYYPTPAWCVRALRRHLEDDLPGGVWLEAGAGDGAIARAFADRTDVTFDLVELRPEAAAVLEPLRARGHRIECPCDYLARPAPTELYEVAIGNPPFSLAERFVAKLLAEARMVVLILPLQWMGAVSRARFHRDVPADVYVLVPRPKFSGAGNDMRDVAWWVWCRPNDWFTAKPGRWTVLQPEGAADQAELFEAGGAR